MSRRRVVITGLGPITCIGKGVEGFWKGILTEKTGISPITGFDMSGFGVRVAGQINDWDPEEFFPPHRLKRLDRYAQFSVASSKLALDDAGIEYSHVKREARFGVSFGPAPGGVGKAEEQYIRFLKKGARGVQPTLAVQVFGGSAHSSIAIDFGLRGVGTTNSNSCASGTVSVGEALRYIRDGFVDIVIAGGAEAPLTGITVGAFDIIKTMSRCEDPEKACRPFDKLRDGFVIGEGAASLIVEGLEHARARGAKIYAELLGYSLNNDGFHMTTPLPSGESCIRAMREALADAKLASDQIDYINAHASSTQLNDAAETLAIKKVFGEHSRKIPVSGTKAFTSHPLGATGAIEPTICTLALEHQYIPPTLHRDHPDEAYDLDVVPHHGRATKLNYIMSNSFGFGGINACVILGKLRD